MLFSAGLFVLFCFISLINFVEFVLFFTFLNLNLMNDLNDIFQFNYILNLVNIIMGHTLATWMAKTSCQILN